MAGLDFGFSFNVVTNTRAGDGEDDDPGANRTVQGSLRQFVQNANAIAGPNAMRFVPVEAPNRTSGADAWWRIAVSNQLPTLNTAGTSIDGTARDLADGTSVRNPNSRGPELELDGTGTAVGIDGIRITGGTATVHGLAIGGFGRDGIRISVSGSNVLTGNHLGVDPTGTADAGNGNDGLRVLSAPSNSIGGSAATERNVVSGNANNGILVDGVASTGNVIAGNYVGLDATGTVAIPNSDDGVDLSDAPNNTVGGVVAGAGNVISGQGDVGLLLVGTQTQGNRVEGNRIGTNALGTAAVPNGKGIGISGGASSNVIGGTVLGSGNLISGNTFDGIEVAGAGSVGNALLGNSLVGNGGLGIDLVGGTENAAGVTANDPLDGDVGPNGLVNHPVILSATESLGIVMLAGEFDVPAGNYRLEFFLNPSGSDGSGYGEGEVIVGTATLSHSGSGAQPFGAAFPGSAGDVVTATLTAVSAGPAYGPSSEFSPAAVVIPPGGTARDSSMRRSDLEAKGGLDLAVAVPGIVGNGIDLGGGAERLVGAGTDLLSGQLTLSAWVRLDTAGVDPRIVAKAATDGTAIYELLVDDATAEAVARLDLGGSTVEVRGGSVPVGSWHQVAATWDGTTARLYVDGAEVDTVAATGALGTDVSVPLVIGNLAAADRGLDGRVDQAQVDHTARSAEWIATAHANVVAPAAFVSMGGVQTSAPAAWTISTTIGRTGGNSLMAPETVAGADAWATAVGLDEPGIEFESWWQVSDPTLVEVASGSRTGSAPTDQHETASTGAGFDLATIVGRIRTQETATPATLPPAQWVRVVLRTDELGFSRVWVDGTQVLGPILHGGGASSGSVGLRAGVIPVGQTWHVDDTRVRRLVSDEPVTSLGALDRN